MSDRGLTPMWAFLGSLGLREIAVVAAVSLILYGRSGLMRARTASGLRRWVTIPRPSPSGRPTPASSQPRRLSSILRGDRLFWMLAIIAAAAVAAWVATRMLVVQTSH